MSYLIQNTRLLFAILLIFGKTVLSAQAPLETEVLWQELEELIQKGNPIALRDIATFLDKPAYTERTRLLLTKHCFFTKTEIDVAQANRSEFLGFYYNHQKILKYSEILNAFYLTPVEYQDKELARVQYRMSEVQYPVSQNPNIQYLNIQFDSLLQKKATDIDFQWVIKKIATLETPESYAWIRQKLANEPFGKAYSENYQRLCEALKNDPSVLSLKSVLSAIERGLVREELLTDVLLELTNMLLSPKKYQIMLDSFGSLETLRALGYDSALRFRISFFYEKVDYYGKTLSYTDAPHWIQRNALRDLLALHHPRSLFFIAAQVRLKPNDKAYYQNLLKQLTGLSPQITNDTITNNPITEIEYWKNYVRWWAIHAEDFVWDDSQNKFVDKTEMVARTEEVERLMRRLSSSNDSVAMASYQQLTHFSPSVIIPMIEQFRPLLRSYNTRLPDLNTPYLETMSVLTELCRNQNLSLSLAPTIDSLLSKLADTEGGKKRHFIENQILAAFSRNELQLNQIAGVPNLTALEYYGLLHAADKLTNFSISRLLDRLYTQYWQKIVSNESALRFYLKKSSLFQKLGVAGTSALYEKKLNRHDIDLRLKLENLVHHETDIDIRRLIFQWLSPPVGQPKAFYTEAKPLDTASQNIEEKLRLLGNMPEVGIDEINEIVTAENFFSEGQAKSSTYKSLVINVLKKIRPLSSIRNFALKNWLKASTDLTAFEDISIPVKDLDDLLRVFEPDTDSYESGGKRSILWDFTNKKIATYTAAERGSFWNSMFKVLWFTDKVYTDSLPTAQRDTILASLQTYLNTHELLSEFEEQTTVTHILELENIGRTLTEKLEATIALDASEVTKASVQAAILARVRYEDIPRVVKLADRLSPRLPHESPLHFLETDFGIPLSIESPEALSQLIENHRLLSPKAFYAFYLKDFGLDIWEKQKMPSDTVHEDSRGGGGRLDYRKIYDLLSFESVAPFTGGGERREFFIYGLIKLLELEHQTLLGFPEKLNENQTFYTYNAAKRAAIWRQFLVTQKRVESQGFAPSFSD